MRWRIFLRQQGIELAYRHLLLLTWAGQFFNSILPGSTGGDVVKIYQICRAAPDRKAKAASTVLVDRLSALFALLVLAGGALFADPKPLTLLPLPKWPGNTMLVVATGLIVLALGAVWVLVRLTKGSVLAGRVQRTLLAARHNLVFSSSLVAALTLAFVVHLLNFLTIYLFARALNLPISYGQVLSMMPVILFLVLIPITINGHGLREVLLISYFGYLGIAAVGFPVRESAIALSLLVVANDLLWSLPGGISYLLFFRGQERRSSST